MKKIEAILRPFKLEGVRDALKEVGIDGMTIFEVDGHGRQRAHKEVYGGQDYEVDLLLKVKLECILPDERVDETVGTIIEAARTGLIGDGKIFVSDVPEAIQIRSGQFLADAS